MSCLNCFRHTRLPQDPTARLTGGLHFPHRRLILRVSGGAIARPTEAAEGIGSLRYFFEKYAFDTDCRELHRGADVVSLAPQVFDLLEYLIRNRERVVTKDDLISAVGTDASCQMPRLRLA
jgi:DNA-binding response OmpR family regulator